MFGIKKQKQKKLVLTVSLFNAAPEMKATLFIMLFNSNCYKVLHTFHFTSREKQNEYSCLELHLDN